MSMALRNHLAIACVLLATPATASPDHRDLLEQARAGDVLPAADLLKQLYSEPRGSILGLIEAVHASLEQQPNEGLERLIAECRELPAEVLAHRMSMPEESRDAETWVHGIGITTTIVGSLAAHDEVQDLTQVLQAPEWISAGLLGPEEAPLERAITAFLLRDEASYYKIDALYASMPDWATPAYLRAISGTRTLRALRALPHLLGRREGMDTSVLTQIASVARYARAPLEDVSLGRVRSYLHSNDHQERRAAAQALGFLDDTESILDLIGLLRDKQVGVRQASYGSLRSITAMTMDPGYGRWIGWHQSESRWWREEANQHLVKLNSSNDDGLVVALRELGSRRLFRREIAPSIRPLLNASEGSTIRIALSALSALRVNDEATLNSVAALLEHPEPSIRRQALSSLNLITRRQFQLPVSMVRRGSHPVAK